MTDEQERVTQLIVSVPPYIRGECEVRAWARGDCCDQHRLEIEGRRVALGALHQIGVFSSADAAQAGMYDVALFLAHAWWAPGPVDWKAMPRYWE